MKVLLINGSDVHSDYLCDMILDGLIKNESIELDQYPPAPRMYRESCVCPNTLHGQGYTLYKKIPGNVPTTNFGEVNEKIGDKYYDVILFGSIHRTLSPFGYSGIIEENLNIVNNIVSLYDQNQVIMCDGEDGPVGRVDISSWTGKARIYQRENDGREKFLPVSFAFPKTQIPSRIVTKENEMCSIIPGKTDTYIRDNEEEYYKVLGKSKFVTTTKKGGWDCLRHYEILFNGSVPYFPDIHKCPDMTLHNHRKDLYLEANRMYECGNYTNTDYENLRDELYTHALSTHTTEKLVEYVMGVSGC